ncbi:MAG: hypothetical protein ACFE0Q_15075 [Anaerolineae bacterium]
MRNRKWQQRITLFLGIFLSFGMVIGLVTPLLLNQQSIAQPQTRPTNTPRPTQPVPPDTANINFDTTYLHPSGLFTASIPTNYELTNEFNSTGEAQVTMEDRDALSVLEIRVIRPTDTVALDTPQSLGAQFTTEWLRSSWSRYSTWEEDARRVDDDRLVMDFNLTRNGQNYVARQVAFTDGTWIYTLRVVSPSNATEVMQYVLENQVASFEPIERYVGERLEWNGYFDDSTNHLVRFPSEWMLVDGSEGRPASIAGNDTQLRVETTDATIDSEASASEFVSGLRSNIDVLSVEAVDQYGDSGFRVAYTQSTLDGATQSGVVLLVNGTNTTHVLNLLLENVADTDLNAVDVTAEDTDLAIVEALNVLDTFSILPDLEVTRR